MDFKGCLKKCYITHLQENLVPWNPFGRSSMDKTLAEGLEPESCGEHFFPQQLITLLFLIHINDLDFDALGNVSKPADGVQLGNVVNSGGNGDGLCGIEQVIGQMVDETPAKGKTKQR